MEQITFYKETVTKRDYEKTLQTRYAVRGNQILSVNEEGIQTFEEEGFIDGVNFEEIYREEFIKAYENMYTELQLIYLELTKKKEDNDFIRNQVLRQEGY